MTAIRSFLPATLLGLIAVSLSSQVKPQAPPKPDIPFLVHATSLLETESNVAVEHEQKKDLIYTVAGASSGVETPRARPEFVIRSERLDPGRLQLYGFESKNGRRELLLRKKKKIVARPYFLSLEGLGDGLYLVRVDDVLDNGEYCLTPDGSNDVFCFTVF